MKFHILIEILHQYCVVEKDFIMSTEDSITTNSLVLFKVRQVYGKLCQEIAYIEEYF